MPVPPAGSHVEDSLVLVLFPRMHLHRLEADTRPLLTRLLHEQDPMSVADAEVDLFDIDLPALPLLCEMEEQIHEPWKRATNCEGFEHELPAPRIDTEDDDAVARVWGLLDLARLGGSRVEDDDLAE